MHDTPPEAPSPEQAAAPDLDRLRRLIGRLRADDGCPWDQEQTLDSLRPALLEEAHELAAALDSGAADEISEELGDLLFQAAFVGRLGEEQGRFSLAGAIDAVHDKMVARHPHVFGPEAGASDRPRDADAVARAWEEGKVRERAARSLLDGLPRTLPSLTAALRLTQKAAGVGFDWPDADSVAVKVREELDELERARGANEVTEELGDLLFAVANLARHHRVDPEAALAAANRKFRRRFAGVEELLRAEGGVAEADFERMEDAWRAVKSRERES